MPNSTIGIGRGFEFLEKFPDRRLIGRSLERQIEDHDRASRIPRGRMTGAERVQKRYLGSGDRERFLEVRNGERRTPRLVVGVAQRAADLCVLRPALGERGKHLNGLGRTPLVEEIPTEDEPRGRELPVLPHGPLVESAGSCSILEPQVLLGEGGLDDAGNGRVERGPAERPGPPYGRPRTDVEIGRGFSEDAAFWILESDLEPVAAAGKSGQRKRFEDRPAPTGSDRDPSLLTARRRGLSIEESQSDP